MIAAVRRQKIRDIVFEKKSATVAELAQYFSVTEETIRRDLKTLEQQGILMRSYGGAFVGNGVENLVNVNIRSDVYVDQKTTIAQRALNFISNGDTLFLDNSTTAYHIARLLTNYRVTVLTNSLLTINLLADYDSVRLIAIGGDYSASERAFYGNITVNTLERYYVDKAFMSCRSLALNTGITDSTDRWVQVRRCALKHSNQIYFVADFSKFDNTSFTHLCDFNEVNYLITDKPQRSEWHTTLAAQGCKLIDQDLPKDTHNTYGFLPVQQPTMPFATYDEKSSGESPSTKA